MNDHALWEQITQIRESQARTETKTEMFFAELGLMRSKDEAMEARIYSLEQYKASTRAEAEAAMKQAQHAESLIAAYDLPPTQFKEWKAKVDAVVNAFVNNQLVVSVRQEMRKSAVAALAGICGFAAGALPVAIKYLGG